MYGKTGCGYCDKAKNLFNQHGIEYDYRDTALPGVKNELLLRYPEAATLPQIFVENTLIGGFDKLSEYIQSSQGN